MSESTKQGGAGEGALARWESRGGKYYVELRRDQWGYAYKGHQCGGSFNAQDDSSAIAHVESRLGDFQADANKTPMQRVY